MKIQKNKIKKIKLSLVILISLLSIVSVSATLEGAVFGFGKDMAMSSLSGQNPTLGQAISFAMCPQCAATSQAMSALNQVIPGSSEIISAIQSPESYIMNKAKQEAIQEIYKKLDPEEQQALNNIQKIKPYMEEAFEVNPDAPKEKQKGSIEIDENGDTIIKTSGDEIFAKIPKGYDVVESEEGFSLTNKNAKTDSVLEIKGNKISLDKNSTIVFKEEKGIETLSISSGSIDINGKLMRGIENATIKSSNGTVLFAEFNSPKGGKYDFEYEGQEYNFDVKSNGSVLFDPQKNQIKGKNTDLQLNGTSANLEVNLNNGIFKDNKNGLEYSSAGEFNVYFDGRDIKGEKNAISVLKKDDETHIYGQGQVKILKPEKFSYTGQSEDAFVDYYLEDSLFDVQSGDALLKNKLHEFTVEDGTIKIQNKNLNEGGAESFQIKTEKDGKEYLNRIDESNGELTLAIYEDGEPMGTFVPKTLYEENAENSIGKLSGKTIDEQKNILKQLKESGGSKKDIDALELGILEQENINLIADKDMSGAVLKLESYIEESRDPNSELNARLSLAELYTSSGEEDKAIEMYKSVWNTYEYPNARKFEGLDDSQARIALGQIYLEKSKDLSLPGDYEREQYLVESRKMFDSLNSNRYSEEIKSFSNFGTAYIDTISNKEPIEKLLTKLDVAIEQNPNNQQAIALKRNLELATLKNINKAAVSQRDKASDLFYDKLMGNIDKDDGYVSTVWKGAYRGIMTGGQEQFGGHPTDNFQFQLDGINYELTQDQIGAITAAKLLETGEINSISEYSSKGMFGENYDPNKYDTLKLKIARAFEEDVDSEKTEKMMNAFLDVQGNSDFQKLADKTYANGERFQYVDYSDLDKLRPDLSDKFADQLNVENLAIFAGPMATVKGVSVAGWAGRGVKVLSGAGRTAEGYVGLKSTIAGSKTIQTLYQTYPKLTKAASLVGSEILESGVGYVAETVMPGSGFATEMFVGHSQVFDIVQEVIEKSSINGVKGALKASDINANLILTKGSEPIYGLEFPSKAARDVFISNSLDGKHAIEHLNKIDDFVLETEDGKKILVYYAEKEEIKEAAQSIISGKTETRLTNFDVENPIKVKTYDIENPAAFGTYNGMTNEITLNLESIDKISGGDPLLREWIIEDTIAHEAFHAKFRNLPYDQYNQVITSFKNNPDYPKMKELFLEQRPGYSSLPDERIINELISHSAGMKYSNGKILGWPNKNYQDMLRDIQTDALANINTPRFILGEEVESLYSLNEISETISPLNSARVASQAESAVEISDDVSTVVERRALASESREKFLNLAEREEFTTYPINAKNVETDQNGLFSRNLNKAVTGDQKEIAVVYRGIGDIETLNTPFKLETYQGWQDANLGRVFDLDSHLEDGKFIFYDQPAEGSYIWTINKNGDFNIGLRADAGSANYKYTYLEHSSPESKILPHSVVAGGEDVFGAGEVIFKNGKVSEVNAFSGHYIDTPGNKVFNENSVNAFKTYSEIKGLEFTPDVVFETRSPQELAAELALTN